jgi:hypothetical protein
LHGDVFRPGTPGRYRINLSARQRFARIDTKVGDPEQGGERIDRSGPLTNHLFPGHDKDPKGGAGPLGARPAEP